MHEKLYLNDTDVIDYLANEDNFKDVPKELLKEGKSVIDNHTQIADGQFFIIQPDRRAFLIRVEVKENVKERELTPEEYMIIDGIEKC